MTMWGKKCFKKYKQYDSFIYSQEDQKDQRDPFVPVDLVGQKDHQNQFDRILRVFHDLRGDPEHRVHRGNLSDHEDQYCREDLWDPADRLLHLCR